MAIFEPIPLQSLALLKICHPWQILSLPVYSAVPLYTGCQGASHLALSQRHPCRVITPPPPSH
ncbi:MAG: hypothetical protein LBD20_00100 [Spirochaetaceae bacterium]|nr:hypothetical protein [Spirochaetaceae bacterium]